MTSISPFAKTRCCARADRVAIPPGGSAFDILEALVKPGGQLVTRNELTAQDWSSVAIKENTLQVSALHRAFGSQRTPV